MLTRLIDDPRHYDDKVMSPEDILSWFDVYDAVWVHDASNSKAPHAKLRSGKCSNGFFDCLRVLSNARLCEILAFQLARKLKESGIEKVDWVIGSAYAAITFSHEVAKAYGATAAFTEKDPSDPEKKKMVWRRRQIPKGEVVLQVEELITTSGTFKEVRRAVNESNHDSVNWLPVVGALVHRPPKLPVDYDGIEVVSLIEQVVWAVEKQDCHLCAAGSPRYEPKTNWAKLIGRA